MKKIIIYTILICAAIFFVAQNTHAQVYYNYDALGNRIERYELKSAQIVPDSINHSDPVIFEEAGGGIQEEAIFSNQLGENKISVFPNPTHGAVNVKFAHLPKGENTRLAVFNANGTLVSRQKVTSTNTRVNLAFQPNGMYMIVVETGEKTISWKIVKK